MLIGVPSGPEVVLHVALFGAQFGMQMLWGSRMTEREGQASIVIQLGGERVELEHVEATEALGRPFEIVVDVYAKLGEVDFAPHLGKPATVTIQEHESSDRHFNGLLVQTEYLRESLLGYHYRLTLAPWTHFINYNSAYRIHQDLSALDIIKKTFADAGLSDVEYKSLTRTYPPRAYCVQYGESDFAFISRLMEQEGIYYYFRHEATCHVMVLCDGPNSHPQSALSKLEYNSDPVGIHLFDEVSKGAYAYLTKLHERTRTQGETQVVLRDFDLAKPNRPVQATWNENPKHQGDAAEVFEYPGHFTDEMRGAELSKSILLARRRDRKTYHGDATTSQLSTGGLIAVSHHPTERFNAQYLVTSTHHVITVIVVEGADRDESQRSFAVRFDAIPAATPFQSTRTTPRPRVRGLETAIVSGPEGETIFTDEYGRVKVRFPWDRATTTGDKSTCWVRVAQFGNLGSLILPRVGQEVMVDFLDGDPDHPVVVGWTFNKTVMPVYDLPAHKTRATWRTRRYGQTGQYPNAKALDTGAPGANELRFEDKGGAEEVFLHAERDMNTRIRFAETHHVGQNQSVMVGYDRADDIGNDETTTIGHDQTLSVGANQTETIGAARKVDVSRTDTLSIGQSQTVKAGTTIEMTAGQSITLKVGSSSIVVDQTGVTIKGLTVTVQGEVQVSVSGALTSISGKGMTTIKGGMVLIN